MVQIVPTLFATNEEDYKKRIEIVSSSKSFTEGWVQMDLMDNKFVPNQGVTLETIKRNPVRFKKEAQLMVIDPMEWIGGLLEFGVDRIVFPVEISHGISQLLDLLASKVERGLSLNPETPMETLDPYISKLEAILLMSVKPGLETQPFDRGVLKKIEYIKSHWQIKVGVDGGINEKNAYELSEAGADYLAVGSFLFTGDFDENLERLLEAIK